jgi:hypothetical protein
MSFDSLVDRVSSPALVGKAVDDGKTKGKLGI